MRGLGEKLPGQYGYSGVGAVVGATYPAQLEELRAAMPHTFFLVPGYAPRAALPTTWLPALTRTVWALSSTPPGASCAPGRRRRGRPGVRRRRPPGSHPHAGRNRRPYRPDQAALRKEKDHEIRFQALQAALWSGSSPGTCSTLCWKPLPWRLRLSRASLPRFWCRAIPCVGHLHLRH